MIYKRTRQRFFPAGIVLVLIAILLVGCPGVLFSQTDERHSSAPDDRADPDSGRPGRASDLPVIDSFAPIQPQVETVADSLEYSREQKKVIARGNVVIRYRTTHLTADYAEVETTSKRAYARGHVVIFEDGRETTKTDEIYYDFETNAGSAPQSRYAAPPWYLRGEDVQQVERNVKVLCRAGITSCNMEEPYYELRARKMTIYESEKVVAQDVTLYVHNVPIFWMPYFIVPLDWEIPISVSAGYNARWGAYLLMAKKLAFTPNIGGKLYLDWRSRRGFGAGMDMDYDYGAHAQGLLQTYITQDRRAPNPTGVEPFSELGDRSRGRISVRHKTTLDDYSYLLGRFNWLSDQFFLQEFFEKEFRSEIDPQSFLVLTKNAPKYGFYAMGQKRMNRFEKVVEKLPTARFDWRAQKIDIPSVPVSPFYQAQISYGNLQNTYGFSSHKEHAHRVDLFQELSLPMKWREIKLTPFTGIRETFYSRQRQNSNPILRHISSFGADLRTQAYRLYPTSVNWAGIEINQIRHIIEPSVDYRYAWSTNGPLNLSQFDHIDRLDDENVLRFGLENRFQTKRVVNGRVQRVDFISLNTYLSHEWNPSGITQTGLFAPYYVGKFTRSNFSVLSQEVVVRPYNWLQYELRMDFDMRQKEFRALTNDVSLQSERVNLVFGHRYIQNFQWMRTVNQFVFDGKWIINRLWDLGGYVRWDAKTNKMEEWQVAFTRKLACDWVLDFGYNVRHSAIQNYDNTLFFNFYLKPLPIVSLRTGPGKASFGPPAIGTTVAGSNAGYGASAFSFDTVDAPRPVGGAPR
jgi:lipopolysaccharide assembly outer membrane protein LptD (OstA)